MKIILLFISVILIVEQKCWSFTINSTVLSNIIIGALEKDTGLKELSNQVNFLKQDIIFQKQSLWPDLSLSTGIYDSSQPSSENLSLNVNVRMDYDLLGINKKKLELKKIELNLMEQQYRYKQKKKDVIRNMTSLYYDILLKLKNLEIIQQEIAKAENEKKLADVKNEMRNINPLEYKSVDIYLLSVLNQYEMNKIELDKLLNQMNPYYELNIENLKEEISILPIPQWSTNVFNIKYKMISREQIKLDRILQKINTQASLTLFANYNFNYYTSSGNESSINTGLSFSLPLSDWLSFNANASYSPGISNQTTGVNTTFQLLDENKKFYNFKKMELNYEKQLIDLQNDIITTKKNDDLDLKYINVNSNLVVLAEKQLNIQELHVKRQQIQLEQGLSSYKDFLDSKLELLQKRVAYYQSIINFNKHLLNLEAARIDQ